MYYSKNKMINTFSRGQILKIFLVICIKSKVK